MATTVALRGEAPILSACAGLLDDDAPEAATAPPAPATSPADGSSKASSVTVHSDEEGARSRVSSGDTRPRGGDSSCSLREAPPADHAGAGSSPAAVAGRLLDSSDDERDSTSVASSSRGRAGELTIAVAAPSGAANGGAGASQAPNAAGSDAPGSPVGSSAGSPTTLDDGDVGRYESPAPGYYMDRYGFYVRDGKALTTAEAARRKAADRAAARLENLRLEKWRSMLGPGLANWARVVQKSPKMVKRRIRKGIPDPLRGRLWALLSGAAEARSVHPGVYADLCRAVTVSHASTIDRDIARTFPTHYMFRRASTGGQTALRKVLRAYSAYRPDVGYCQGMGFLAGLLLSYMPEEEAFWMLTTLMHEYGMEGLYRPGLPRFQLVTYQFQALLQRFLPKLAAHLEANGVHTSMFASSWFITCFTYAFPFELVTRIWDIFIAEGWKIIFRVAVALLKMGQKELLKLPFEEILPMIKELPTSKSAEEIMTAALKIPLTTRELEKLQHAYCAEFGMADPADVHSDPSGATLPTGGDLRGSGDSGAQQTAAEARGRTATASSAGSLGVCGPADGSGVLAEAAGELAGADAAPGSPTPRLAQRRSSLGAAPLATRRSTSRRPSSAGSVV